MTPPAVAAPAPEPQTVPALTFTGVTYDIPPPHSRLKALGRLRRERKQEAQLDVEAGNGRGPTEGASRILRGVSGCVARGESLAVLGPSGAGKSSLLNLLAGRAQYPIAGGGVQFYGRKRNSRTKRKVGYCTQDDVFFTKLTVKETLEFTAEIRIESGVDGEERRRRVEDIVKKLRLGKCLDTQIGEAQFNKGISGGERKRLNIANELLGTPEDGILLLDEPTSGLESAGALTVVRLLRQLADEGRAIVSTIHQPTSLMWSLFDSVLLLSEGEAVYFGPTSDATEYFVNIGFPIPPHYNPADYIMQLLIEDDIYSPEASDGAQGNGYIGVDAGMGSSLASSRSSTTESGVSSRNQGKSDPELVRHYLMRMWRERGDEFLQRTRPDHLMAIGGTVFKLPVEDGGAQGIVADKWKTTGEGKVGTFARGALRATSKRFSGLFGCPDPSGLDRKYATTWMRQVGVLGVRAMRQKRGALVDKVQLAQLSSIIIVCGLFWFRMDKTEATLDDRLGSMFFYGVFFSFFATYSALYAFPAEKAVLNKDRSSGAYRLSAYYFAKTCVEVPADMIYPTMFSTVVYWMTGLNAAPDRFFVSIISLVSLTLTSQSLGLFLSASIMEIRQAQVVASTTILSSMLLGGFYVDRENIPKVLWPLRHASFIKYAYNALVRNETRGELYPCVPPGAASTVYSDNGTRCPITGQDVLVGAQLDDTPTILANIAILVLWIIGLRILGYLALKYLHRPHKERMPEDK